MAYSYCCCSCQLQGPLHDQENQLQERSKSQSTEIHVVGEPSTPPPQHTTDAGTSRYSTCALWCEVIQTVCISCQASSVCCVYTCMHECVSMCACMTCMYRHVCLNMYEIIYYRLTSLPNDISSSTDSLVSAVSENGKM